MIALKLTARAPLPPGPESKIDNIILTIFLISRPDWMQHGRPFVVQRDGDMGLLVTVM